MEIVTLSPEQDAAAKKAEAEALEVREKVKTFLVRNDAEYQAAGEYYAAIKKAIKKAEAERKELVGPLKEVAKKIEARFNGAIQELEVALEACERPMKAYLLEQKRQREEAERKAREEEDRIRREKEEEARLLKEKMLEEQRKADALKEQASKTEDPLQALLLEDQAAQAESASAASYDQARTSIIEASKVEVAVAAPPKPIVAGVRSSFPWKHKVVDPSLVPDEFWVLDESKLARVAREQKEKASVPGVEFYQDVRLGGA